MKNGPTISFGRAVPSSPGRRILVFAGLFLTFLLIARKSTAQLSGDVEAQITQATVQLFAYKKPSAPHPEGRSLDWENPVSYGCGTVIHEAGIILTTRHLLGDIPNSMYRIRLPGSSKLTIAKPIAADSWIDLAILKIPNAPAMQKVDLSGTSANSIAGKKLFVANENGERSPQFTSGIAGFIPLDKKETQPASSRHFDSFSSDCQYQHGGIMKIESPGNFRYSSGRGVFDANGKLVGLTTALTNSRSKSRSRSDHTEIAFIALTHSVVGKIQPMLGGRLPDYPFLGLTLRNLTESQAEKTKTGVQVIDVVTNSPADEHFQFADVITHVNDVVISDRNQFWEIVNWLPTDSPIRLTGVRGALGGQEKNAPIALDVSIIPAKRRKQTRRPGWQTAPVPSWNGMRVEDPFAIPEYRFLLPYVSHRKCVAVADVQLNSTAWLAGVRPGVLIHQIDGLTIESPQHFLELANQSHNRPVTLIVTDPGSGEKTEILIRVGNRANPQPDTKAGRPPRQR